MISVNYLNLGAAREIEERTGKNAIDFMDIPDDGDITDYEKEPEYVAKIKNTDGQIINSILSTNKDMVKNWLISEIKKLDVSDCYSFSMYEVEQ